MTEHRSFDEPSWTQSGKCPVRFIPNSESFISGGHDGSIKVWNANADGCQACFVGHNASVSSIDVSPCGNYIVAGDNTKITVELYNMNGHCSTYMGHTGDKNCVAFSPCGRFIVSGGFNDHLMLTWVNWKMLQDDGVLQARWRDTQYAGVNFEGASIEDTAASSLRG